MRVQECRHGLSGRAAHVGLEVPVHLMLLLGVGECGLVHEWHCPPTSLSLSPSCREPVVIIPDSEDEEEQARLCCISASQAAVADVLCEAAGADRPSGSGGTADPAAAAAAWQQNVVLQGAASLTLLLPRDARGELGSDTRCFAVPAGGQAGRELTAAQLLAFVHGYYAEEVRRVLWKFYFRVGLVQPAVACRHGMQDAI